MTQLTSEAIYSLCLNDPEFQMASRHWTGGVRFEVGTEECGVCVNEGEVEVNRDTAGDTVVWTVTFYKQADLSNAEQNVQQLTP